MIPPHEFPAAIIAAHRGRIDEARARAQGAVARAEAEGIGIGSRATAGCSASSSSRWETPPAALAYLRRAYELRNAFMLEPAQRLELGDLLEALIAVGELDEADESSRRGRSEPPRSTGPGRSRSSPAAAGCCSARAAISSGAFASFERALAEHARSTDPFHTRGRCSPSGGRSGGRRSAAAARTTLEDALARFERLGAPLWAEQTRAELARIGGRAPSGDELTEAEPRIARLVAEGRTNREVAATLFLTVHSVETALTRVYRKLGVRSRAELARLLRRPQA